MIRVEDIQWRSGGNGQRISSGYISLAAARELEPVLQAAGFGCKIAPEVFRGPNGTEEAILDLDNDVFITDFKKVFPGATVHRVPPPDPRPKNIAPSEPTIPLEALFKEIFMIEYTLESGRAAIQATIDLASANAPEKGAYAREILHSKMTEAEVRDGLKDLLPTLKNNEKVKEKVSKQAHFILARQYSLQKSKKGSKKNDKFEK